MFKRPGNSLGSYFTGRQRTPAPHAGYVWARGLEKAGRVCPHPETFLRAVACRAHISLLPTRRALGLEREVGFVPPSGRTNGSFCSSW